jgi:hypothetical protein
VNSIFIALGLSSNIWTFWPGADRQIALSPDPYSDKYYHRIFCFLFIAAAIVNTIFINVQIWQDELYTLDKFVLVPVSTTITDYHTTNNHIVFNLICSLYLKVIGIHQLEILLEHPRIIRIIPYIFAILSIWAFYRCARTIQTQPYAIISTGIFTSFLQLYTFGTQIRGYSLDILLSIFLLHFIFLFYHDQRKKWLYLIVLTGFLLLVNLPSTIYYFISLIILIFIFRKRISARIAYRLLLALCTAFLFFAVFFALKSSQLVENSMLFDHRNSIFDLIKHPFAVIYRFIDWRFILIFPIIAVFFNRSLLRRTKISILLTGLFALPFVLFLLHNLPIILRIWLILIPAFCLWFADWWMPVFEDRKRLILPFVLMLQLCLAFSLVFLRPESLADNAKSIASTDLRWQYQLFNYNPRDVAQKAREIKKEAAVRVCLDEHWLYGMLYYLKDEELLPTDSIHLYKGNIFLISQYADDLKRMSIPLSSVIDSGKDNSSYFYKWYLIKNDARR